MPLHGFGPRILLFRFNFSFQTFNVADVIRLCVALHEVMIVGDPYAGVHGLIYVIDLAQCSAEHITGFNPKLLKMLNGLKEKALPFRLKACYLINVAPYLEQFLKMALACVPEKFRKRVRLLEQHLYGYQN